MMIDGVTGLPEVPEGHFWEVERTKDAYESSLLLFLYKDVLKEVPVAKTRQIRTWRTLWFAEKENYTETENRVDKLMIYSRLMADRAEAKGSEEIQTYLDKGWEIVRTKTGNGVLMSAVFEKLWEPTADSVMRAATEIMVQVNKDLADKEKKSALLEAQEGLIGKYPPKRLEETVVSTSSVNQSLQQQIESLARQLKDLQVQYRTGEYSGHPEEMLELIEDTKEMLDRLRKEL